MNNELELKSSLPYMIVTETDAVAIHNFGLHPTIRPCALNSSPYPGYPQTVGSQDGELETAKFLAQSI